MNEITRLLSNKISFPQGYHKFIDKRTFGGIPNFINIVSNLAIALPAFYLMKKQKKISFLSINILLLAITSALYHVNPNNNTIFLDMLFVMSINTVVLSYFVNKQVGNFIYILGILSVFYWKKYDDLRFYEFLKIAIPVYAIFMLYKNPKVSNYVFPVIILTILIRVSEYNDKAIYKLTGGTISGHTLKHILSALDIYLIIIILDKLGKV